MNFKKSFILTKTPLRVSFFGGGTDLPNFFNRFYGHVISSSINSYVYTAIKSHDGLFGEDYRLNYSKTEHVKGSLINIDNNIIRSCLKYLKIKERMNITISTDIPSFSGLGSSSSIIVGLLKALYVYKNKKISTQKLAETACKIEIDILKNPIGKQDQYAAAFGGFKSYKFFKKNRVIVKNQNNSVVKKIFKNSLFVWVGNFKQTSKILKDQNKLISRRINYYKELINLVEKSEKVLNKEKFKIEKFAYLLNKNWLLKKKLSKNISNKKIDNLYSKCLKNGAMGGKILGAGSGGFLLLIVKKRCRKKLNNFLKLKKIYSFSGSDRGAEVIYKNFY